MMYDLVIRGGRIVDGTGSETFEADGWDPMLTSVTWHDVTTGLLGNCGDTSRQVILRDDEHTGACAGQVLPNS